MLTGTLSKMRTELDEPVQYYLNLNDQELCLNNYIGSEITLKHTGNIFCRSCGTKTKKSFGEGFCYKCFISSPLTEECVLRPELCRAHEGIARDMNYAKTHCLIDHYVYLANSSSLKVGVTRHHQIPTRWIDQGASFAIPFAKTPDRHTAGAIEVALKEHIADKTNWRNMLKNNVPDIDLLEESDRVATLLPEEYQYFLVDDADIIAIRYPVQKYPDKVKSCSFDKTPEISGLLNGIKGQYLLFDGGHCLNIRKFSGYEITLGID